MGLSLDTLTELNPKLARDLREYFEDLDRDRFHDTVEAMTPQEVLEKWFEWHMGDESWARVVRGVMLSSILASDEYITTTDAEREAWIKKMIGEDR